MFMSRKIRIGDCMSHLRTWSASSAWQDAHPDNVPKDASEKGDVIDETFEEMRAEESKWQQAQ